MKSTNYTRRDAAAAIWLFPAALLLSALAGCARPPATDTGEPGPPKVMHVDAASPEGKALELARKQPHTNFVPPSAPAAGANNAAPGQQPAPGAAPSGAAPSTGPAPAAAGADAQPAGTVRATAEEEAHRKAGAYGQGLIATPLGALQFARTKVASFEIETALKYYVLEKGKPHSTEEFMEKIIKASGLKLPELGPGERYVYDPDVPPVGALLVERPAPQPPK